MVQHAGVYVAHGVAATANDKALEEVNDLSRLEEPVMLDLDEAQVGEGGPDQQSQAGQHHSEGEEGVNEQEGVKTMEEAIGHELFQLSAT